MRLGPITIVVAAGLLACRSSDPPSSRPGRSLAPSGKASEQPTPSRSVAARRLRYVEHAGLGPGSYFRSIEIIGDDPDAMVIFISTTFDLDSGTSGPFRTERFRMPLPRQAITPIANLFDLAFSTRFSEEKGPILGDGRQIELKIVDEGIREKTFFERPIGKRPSEFPCIPDALRPLEARMTELMSSAREHGIPIVDADGGAASP